jgi:hypothetical protein
VTSEAYSGISADGRGAEVASVTFGWDDSSAHARAGIAPSRQRDDSTTTVREKRIKAHLRPTRIRRAA